MLDSDSSGEGELDEFEQGLQGIANSTQVHDRRIMLRSEKLLQNIAERLGMNPMRQELFFPGKQTTPKKLHTHQTQSITEVTEAIMNNGLAKIALGMEQIKQIGSSM